LAGIGLCLDQKGNWPRYCTIYFIILGKFNNPQDFLIVINENELELTTLDLVVKGMLEKKAEDVVILDLANIKTAVTDYFVICSANSDTQADAISTAVQEEVWKAHRQHAYGKEGFQQKEWILLDFGDVVAHIFRKDRREFYALEELWGDAIVVEADAEFEKALYRRLSGEPEEIKVAMEDIKVIKLAENKNGTKKKAAVVKKAAVKKTSKSSSVKKTASKKVEKEATKKSSSKKTPVKKTTVKKAADKKTTEKKSTSKTKSETKKTGSKKAAAATKKSKVVSKNTKTTKTVAKKATVKKKVVKAASKTTKKSATAKSKKPTAKKAPVKKVVAKKATTKKATAPKSTKSAVTKKTAKKAVPAKKKKK
jgi:ribosome-associated protein